MSRPTTFMHDSPVNPEHARHLVIIPAYNEAGSISAVVEELQEHLPGADLLVVDDGSIDGTHDAVPEGAMILRLPFNLGIGGAMQAGYLYAFMHGYETAMQVDGDGQHPAEEASRLLDALKRTHADLVIGSRFLSDGPNYTPPASRAAGIHVLRSMLRMLTGLRVTDCTSGFRICNRRTLEAFARWYPEDYPEPEVILLLHRAGFTITETPVVMRERTAGRTSIPLHTGVFYLIKVGSALLLDMARSHWPKQEPRQP